MNPSQTIHGFLQQIDAAEARLRRIPMSINRDRREINEQARLDLRRLATHFTGGRYRNLQMEIADLHRDLDVIETEKRLGSIFERVSMWPALRWQQFVITKELNAKQDALIAISDHLDMNDRYLEEVKRITTRRKQDIRKIEQRTKRAIEEADKLKKVRRRLKETLKSKALEHPQVAVTVGQTLKDIEEISSSGRAIRPSEIFAITQDFVATMDGLPEHVKNGEPGPPIDPVPLLSIGSDPLSPKEDTPVNAEKNKVNQPSDDLEEQQPVGLTI